ncbi:MAG: hypothetical protein ABIG95_02025 [Candidatus Woesearchaeota archaeon]
MKNKILRIMKDADKGHMDNGKICINVEKLWQIGKGNFKYFAQEFTITHNHELLHLLIQNELGDKPSLVAEEKTVRQMTGEIWNLKLEKQYMEDEKDEK